MFPGFITLYKDDNDYVHLFFYKGLTDNNTFYYNDLDLSALERGGYTHKTVNYNDNSKEYIFDNKNIRSMTCNLSTYNGKKEEILLKIK
jgi:hypothetical protein